jgi:hypothetical protein
MHAALAILHVRGAIVALLSGFLSMITGLVLSLGGDRRKSAHHLA